MLLNQEIEGLQDDDFDGSLDEHHIFKEVFFGNDSSKSNKKCLVTGVINFETDHCKNTNDDNSLLTNRDEFTVLNAKRMKLSHSIYHHPVTCRLVESSSNGVKSSSYLLKRHVGDKFKPNESFVSKQLVAFPFNKPRWKDSCFMELDITEMKIPQISKNDPRPLLRYHIHRLLRGAGWVIGKRKRAKYSTVTGEYVYRSPEGRPIREFRRAWILCGQSLFAYGEDAVIESSSDCKEWTELTHFCADLSNTLSNIQEQFGNSVSTSSLAHCWYILDPFANVVFIDKTMGLLKEGKRVKARRSLVIDSVLALKNVDSTVSDQDFGTREEHCGSDITCDQTCTSLFEVPITFENQNENLNLTNYMQLSTCCESDSQLFETPIYVTDDVSFDAMLKKNSYKKSKKMCEIEMADKQESPMTWHLKDDDLLISAIIKNKKLKSPTNRVSRKSRKRRTQKGGCRLLPRSLDKGGNPCLETKLSLSGNRTVLSWLINSGFISLNEAIEYRDPKDDSVVKDGLVTWDGILCKCCNNVLSVSQFKIHAGFRSNRFCVNIFLQSGKPITLCQLEAWSAEYKFRKSATQNVEIEVLDQNDDSCGLCGDGGELICCDNCPSTFHQACMYIEELPEGSWYCPYCTCRICGDLVIDEDSSQSPIALKCLQCEHRYHEACLEGEGGFESGAASNSWFCTDSCQEVYSGIKSRVGIMNSMPDGFSWTLLKCIHVDQISQKFMALKAECNLKLAVALTIMEECFLPMVDPRTGIDMIPHVLYNSGSEFARLNYHGFQTVVLEKDDVLMCVASIRIHGVEFAEMPLIATCTNYRRQGMCGRLMNGIEEMLTSLKVEKLVISAIPNLVETWKNGFGFEPLEENDKKALSTINLMVFPGAIWLKKQLKGCPTTTMSDGNMRDYKETEKEIKIRKIHQLKKIREEAVSNFEVGYNLKSMLVVYDDESKVLLSQNSSESDVLQGK